MSRKTSTTPATSFLSLRIGAALSSMGRSVPSLAMSSVWFASPTITPSRKARTVGFSTVWRLSWLMMLEHAVERLADRLLLRPAGQGRSHRVEERDLPFGVGGNHGIANAGEGDTTPFRLEVQGFVRHLPVRVGHIPPPSDLVFTHCLSPFLSRKRSAMLPWAFSFCLPAYRANRLFIGLLSGVVCTLADRRGGPFFRG